MSVKIESYIAFLNVWRYSQTHETWICFGHDHDNDEQPQPILDLMFDKIST